MGEGDCGWGVHLKMGVAVLFLFCPPCLPLVRPPLSHPHRTPPLPTQVAVQAVHSQNLSVTVVDSIVQSGVQSSEFQVPWAPLSNLNAVFGALASQPVCCC